MIVKTAVLVIHDHQQRRLAQFLLRPDGVEHVANQDFALLDIVIRMLIACGEEAVCGGVLAPRIARLYEAVPPQQILFLNRKEILTPPKKEALLSHRR